MNILVNFNLNNKIFLNFNFKGKYENLGSSHFQKWSMEQRCLTTTGKKTVHNYIPSIKLSSKTLHHIQIIKCLTHVRFVPPVRF